MDWSKYHCSFPNHIKLGWNLFIFKYGTLIYFSLFIFKKK